MFEQDYIMRVIKEMVRTILKLLFNIDTESPAAEVLEKEEEQKVLNNLLDMIDAGKIDKAENRVYDLISDREMSALEIALLFYSYLNDKSDAFLEEHDFCREEVKAGMEHVVDTYGLNSIAKLFLEDI